MKIFIAGATGVLGRRLVTGLVEAGHEVVGLARNDTNEMIIRRLGGTPARADLFDTDSLTRAAGGAEVVIHAATAVPSGRAAMRRAAWEMNDRIRTEGTRALTRAAAAVGARRYLHQSLAWLVRTAPDGPFFDETTPPAPPSRLRSAVEGEAIAEEAGERDGFSVVVLRCGAFYAPDAVHTLEMAEGLRRRKQPVLGRGDFLVAPIHADDASRAFVMAAAADLADSDVAGTWHVVDDEPVRYATLLDHFAGLLDAPRPRRLPLWIARLLVGSEAVEAVTTSMNTSNTKIRSGLGWAPRYPTYREGLEAVMEVWGGRGRRPE